MEIVIMIYKYLQNGIKIIVLPYNFIITTSIKPEYYKNMQYN